MAKRTQPVRAPFTYTGHNYPALAGKWFPSVAAFCREAGIDSGFVYGRIHQGWSLLRALDLPKLETSDRLGTIYLVTRLSTGERYVGLTIVSVRSRWSQHVRSAPKGASPLGRAIFDDGADGFSVETLEAGISPENLADRERAWIEKLGTRIPAGLNYHPGGALGGGGQRALEVDGEKFRSVLEASEVMAKRHGLTPGAAHQRLRKGMSLETPLKVFQTRGKGVAGSFLWSRWRAMRNNANSELSNRWQDWEQFAADLASLVPSDRLTRIDNRQPWGPDNFTIQPGSLIDHPKVGTVHWQRWRKLLKSADREEGRGVAEDWRDFDTFERDVSSGFEDGKVLVPMDWFRPWGPTNFRWGTHADLSALIGRFGRKATKHGEHATPAYKRWLSMHNDARRSGCGVAAAWHDYPTFRDAVLDGIEQGLILLRLDRRQPWGPTNFRLATRSEYKESLGRFTHGASNTPLHSRWSSLRSRLASSGASCDPCWNSFEEFADDVAPDRPECDLERRDANLPYGPGNFIWVDRHERSAAVALAKTTKALAAEEKRRTREVMVGGVVYRGLYALADAYGLPASTVCFRVRQGMTPEEAVLAPNKNTAAAQPVMLDGQNFESLGAALRYVEARYGVRENTMRERMRSGLSLGQAAHKPLRRNSKRRG